MSEENTLLSQQLEIVAARWPAIHQKLLAIQADTLQVSIVHTTTLSINGIQLTSAWDRLAEAKLQAGQIHTAQPVLFLYGPGLGDCANLLLERPQLRQLHVVLLSLAVFLHTLALTEHSWLQDARTQLHLAEELDDIKTPYIVNPAEMILADPESCILRDCLELELNHTFIQRQHLGAKAVTRQRISDNLPFLQQDSDLSSLPATRRKEIFIAAAGPTLEDHFAWLAAHTPYLIAVDAAVAPLLANGIRPDLIVSIDAHSWHLFSGIPPKALTGIPLVYMPGVETELLHNWPGARYYAYSDTPMYASLPERFRTTPLFSAGSVIHPAIDLAVRLKAESIIFLGADFSFVYGKSHATSDTSKKTTIPPERTAHQLRNSEGNNVPTLPNLKGYLRELERYLKRHPRISFYNGSAKGAEISGTTLWQPS